MKTGNIITGILGSRIFRNPFYVHLYVTRRCNLRCRMCNVWKNKDSKEMTFQEIKIAAKKMKQMGATHIVITGGEPLLRPDIFQIVEIFSKLGMSTRLQTNGVLLTEDKLNQLVKSGLDDITISLDTLDNLKQDDICGVKGVGISDRVVKMLKLIPKKMPKSMSAANIVVSHKNLNEISGLIKFLDSIGIWSTFVPVNLSEKKEDYLFKAKADDFSFDQNDKKNAEEVYRNMLNLKKKGYKIILSSRFLRQSLQYIKTNNKKWKCDAGELYFSIFPDGKFAICDEIPTTSNILEEDFMEFYRSKKFLNFCRNMQNNCEGCFYGCWKETSNLINSPSVVFDRFLTVVRVKRKNL